MRHLIAEGLKLAEDREIIVQLPEGEGIRSVVWLDHEAHQAVKARGVRFHRPASVELVLLVAYALQEVTNRDLAVIKSMLSREGQAAPLQ